MSQFPNKWDLRPLMDYVNSGAVQTEVKPGKWAPVRPLGHPSLRHRFQAAWDVFNGRADALYWPGQ